MWRQQLVIGQLAEMSYQVLARKYRPKSFGTLVGQEHVVRALTHALSSGRLHHAYLFTGTRGVGKTTLSRILAKCFNCLGADGQGGITAEPCGVCAACVAIDAGRFVDYIEMDAASNRGVDEMAQLLEQAVYSPSNARFKVYMIDEVHMLTNTAFNAMLKTLEEPPAHVKFILATTDPQKIPVTVLSRCLQFNLKQMPPAHIISHLENILGQEAISFEVPALRLLAQGAQGSMRDALSLTDQAIAYAAGTVTLDAVQGMLGALDQSFLIQILDALQAQDGPGLLALVDAMSARSLSFQTALQDLASLLHRVAMAQIVPAGLPPDWPEREQILRLAQAFDAEEVQLYYQIALHGKQEMGLAPDEYAGFSMTLLRMLAFRPDALATQSLPPAAAAPNRPRPTAPATQPAPAAPAAPAARPAANPVAASAPAAVAPALAAANPNPNAGRISPAMAALHAARGTAPPQTRPAPTTSASAAAAPAPAAAPAAAISRQSAPPDDGMPQFTSEPPPSLPPDFDTDYSTAQKKTEFDGDQPVKRPPISKAQQDAADAALRIASQITAKAQARANAPVQEVQPEVPAEPEPEQVAPPFVPHPAGDWDGDWPQLATNLATSGAVRGVLRAFAWQTELQGVVEDGNALEWTLRCPLETLCSPANTEKLTAVLCEHFQRTVRIKTELGPAWHSAHQRDEAARQVRQIEAEKAIRADPFVRSLMREFGATLVPDSIRPIVPAVTPETDTAAAAAAA
ncbi:MAG: polymerase subunit gamma and tau [Pseudomonadota bacterium]